MPFDERRKHFLDLAAGAEPYETPADSSDDERFRAVLVARDVMRVADGVVARSWHELDALDARIGEPHPLSERCVAERIAAAPPGSQPANTILVWAPGVPAWHCALHLFALSELHAEVTVVCADGGASLNAPIGRERFIAAADVAALAGVAALLVVEESDPAEALALEAWRVPLAVSSTSGAREYLSCVTIFDPWDFHSIRTAVLNAAGGYPPSVRERVPPVDALVAVLDRAQPGPIAGEPLVSVVMPTKNRAAVLPRAIATVLAQTYRRIEVVVMNDGGADVSGVLPDDPRIRYVNEPPGNGMAEMLERSLRLSNGTFFCMLADDDQFCPDHLERAVAALERTGEMMSRSLAAFNVLVAAGEGYRLLGEFVASSPAYDPTDLLVRNSNGGPSVYRTEPLRTRLRARVEAGHLADLETNLRHLEEFDFVCVRAVTQVNDVRLDGSNVSSNSPGGADRERLAADYRALYEAFPVPDRPMIAAQREKHFAYVLEHALPPAPLIRLLEPPPGEYSSLRRDAGDAAPQRPIATLAPRAGVPQLSSPVVTMAIDVTAVKRWREQLAVAAAGLELARAEIGILQSDARRSFERERHLRASIGRWYDATLVLAEQLGAEQPGRV